MPLSSRSRVSSFVNAAYSSKDCKSCPCFLRHLLSLLVLFAIAVSLPHSALAAFSLKINFQPTGITTPTGYLPDNGGGYLTRSGYSYGWSVATPVMSNPTVPATITDPRKTDIRYTTQAAFTNAVWEAGVPNGEYTVLVVSGDPTALGPYSLNVEGVQPAMSGTTTTSDTWVEQTATVVVTDNRITISSPGGASARLNYVVITQIPLSVKVNFQPPSVTPPTGYIPDSSGGYGLKTDSGVTYGWLPTTPVDTNYFTRTPDTTANVAPYNTVPYTTVVVAGTRTWEMAVANGSYNVRIVAGDASGANLGLYEANVEGVKQLSKTLTATTAANHFADVTFSTTVTDGKLSIALPPGSSGKLHLCFVEVTGIIPEVDGVTPAIPLTPTKVITNRPAAWVAETQPTAGGAGSGGEGSASEGNEINAASGVFNHDHGADITVRNPVGPSVSYGVSYRSAIVLSGYRGVTGTVLYSSPGFSQGWRHSYDIHIEAQDSTGWNPLRVFYPSGQAEDLAVVISGSTPTGRLTPPVGCRYAVVGVPSATTGKWTSITFISGDESRMTFLPVTAGSDIYRLSTIENMLGQAVQLSYDSYSRMTQIANIPSTANGMNNKVLLTLSFPSGSASPAAFNAKDETVSYSRLVAYAMTATQLSSISNVGNTKNIWTYHYGPVAGLTKTLLDRVTRPRPDGASNATTSAYLHYTDDGTVLWTEIKSNPPASPADPNQYTETYTYDPAANKTVIATPESFHSLSYDNVASGNRLLKNTDATGKVATVGYSDPTVTSALNKSTNETGHISTVVYDAYSNITSSSSPSGLAGNQGSSTLITTTTFLPDSAPPATLKYPVGRVTSVNVSPSSTGTSAKTVTYTYWPSGLVKTVTTPAPAGSLASSTVTTTYTYTALGNVLTVEMPGPNTSGATVTYTYEYQDDSSFAPDPLSGGAEALGEPIRITDPLGHSVHLRYDDQGRVTQHYDAVGNRTDFEYNDEDQLTKVTLPPSNPAAPAARAFTLYYYAYTGGPLLKTELHDESGAVSRTINNVKGLDGEGKGENGSTPTVGLAYDGSYRVTTIKDGKANTSGIAYNDRNDVTELRFPSNPLGTTVDNKIQFTSYNPAGDLLSLTNGRGNTVTMDRKGSGVGTTYANNNLVKKITYGGFAGRDINLTYDAYGRVTQRTDGAGSYSYTYGDLDEITSVTTTYYEVNSSGVLTGLNLPTQTISYAYNQDGSLRLKTIQNSATTFGSFTYSYDDAGRVTMITPPWNSLTNSVYSYLYDDADKLTQQRIQYRGVYPVTSSCEVKTNYIYNGRDQSTSLLNTVIGYSNTWHYDWTAMLYDTVGNRTQATITGGKVKNAQPDPISGFFNTVIPSTDGVANWYYDTNDRLVGEKRTNTAGYNELQWDYTATGYGYDNAYNLTTLRAVALPANSYNSNNQLVGVGYNYDGDGNPLQYDKNNLFYDEENRLSQVDRFNTSTSTYGTIYRAGYRGDGMRAWRVNVGGNIVTYFVYDDATGVLLYEVEDNGGGSYVIRNAYGYGGAGLTQRFQPSTTNPVTSYAFDPSGNVCTRVLSTGNDASPSGTPRGIALWDGYGYLRADVSSGSTNASLYHSPQDRYSYTAGYSVGYGAQLGYYTEPNTRLDTTDSGDKGLILCTFRYYDPINARWLTRDPAGYDGGINVYAYVDGNPIMRSDPTGFAPKGYPPYKPIRQPNGLMPEFLLSQWALGKAAAHAKFQGGSYFAEMAKSHSQVMAIRAEVIQQIRAGKKTYGNRDFQYSKFTANYRMATAMEDGLNAASGGQIKNNIESFLGSCAIYVEVSKWDRTNREIQVEYHIWNATTLDSGLRDPATGYGHHTGRPSVGGVLRGYFMGQASETMDNYSTLTGSLQPITQDIYWTERIHY